MPDPERLNPWYNPGATEYAAVVESCGIEVTFARLFDRPTALQDGERGLETWFRMFGTCFTEPLDDAAAREFLRLVSGYAAPQLRHGGVWSADYRRLRITGRKLLRTDGTRSAY